MFNKPVKSATDRLTTLRAQLQVAEAALTQARITRGSLEALRNGVAIVDPREVEAADAAMMAACNNVAQLRTEVSEAERALCLDREQPQREQGKRQLDKLAVDLDRDLRTVITATQKLAATYDRIPVNVLATIPPGTMQILQHWWPGAFDFISGDVPPQIIERLRSYANELLAGQHSADLGLSVIEQDIAFGKRRAA